MKEGDKFINIRTHKDRYENEYISFQIYTVEKFSKDGKKIRAVGNEIFWAEDKKNLTSMQDFQKAITELLKTKATYKHFLVKFVDYPLDYKFGEIHPVIPVEDEFDETAHIRPLALKDSFTVDASLIKNSAFFKLKEQEVEKKYITSYWLANGIDGLVGFFSSKADFLLEKFNNWQERFGFDKTDEFWLDFNGGTTQLEWAIDNNIDCTDYDRWQCLQKILKHELKYETANEMLNTLYDKEDIEIFDCK